MTDFAALPKIELHTHLDCALSFDAVRQLSSSMTRDDYATRFEAPPRCIFADFLLRIDPAIALLQSEPALRRAAADHTARLADDGVVYAEIRFAPLLHTRAGLAPEAVVEAVLSGLGHPSVTVKLLLCTLRHFSTEQGMETLRLAERFGDQGVVGLDLAADEAAFPLKPHVPVFAKARALGLSCTAHAGELRGSDSVAETVKQLGVTRIGHGVRAIEDPDVVELLLERGVHLEVCPSVNIQLGVFPDIAEHPVEQLRKAGVSLGLNTDARTTTGTTLQTEYSVVQKTFGWTEVEFREANRAALAASFADGATRDRVARLLDA